MKAGLKLEDTVYILGGSYAMIKHEDRNTVTKMLQKKKVHHEYLNAEQRFICHSITIQLDILIYVYAHESTFKDKKKLFYV